MSVFWITGRKGSGKTTLAKKLAKHVSGIILDGDKVRAEFLQEGFSFKDRKLHQERMAAFARILEKQGFTVIIACISPDRDVRHMLQGTFKDCIEIQMPFGDMWEGTTYEE